MVRAYRNYGHLEADIDPLGINTPKKGSTIELNPAIYHLKDIDQVGSTAVDIDGIVHIGSAQFPKKTATIPEIVNHLKDVYCGNIAAQFSHLETTKEQLWLAKQLEALQSENMSSQEQKRAMKLMVESEAFDHFMARKFPGVKRYGLEGCESMIYAMDVVMEQLAQDNISDIVLGMPHRGRLNLLTGLLNFPARALFHKVKGGYEFPEELIATGDVLSHLGISTELVYGDKKVSLSLLNNPSHLEAINPVALGKTRAKISHGKNAACILMHGDASFAGQGIVAETFTLSRLPLFKTGGTIHIIVNNQIGFTTAPHLSRSTRYSGDVGKMVGCPILAVNAENVDDVRKVMIIAAKYRAKFNKDIIVELFGYRRHGHNELDEPSFTQPKMYQVIRSKQTFPVAFSEQCVKNNVTTPQEVSKIRENYTQHLDNEYKAVDTYKPEKRYFLGDWHNIIQATDFSKLSLPITGYNMKRLKEIAIASYHISQRLQSLQKDEKDIHVDWATAEVMAFGSLLDEGYTVRLSGQDVIRGTFNQRHLEFVDQENESRILPMLGAIPGAKERFELGQSPLSEFAVMGFEYGYTIDNPNNFSVMEMQFGDFFNGGQIIIDTFIGSGEDKWCLCSGLTLLLPHGMDGAGPEHSSGRIERFLQLCDSDINTDELVQKRVNMCVVNCSTPANYFHVLRRQMKRKFRKPLIVFTPKILLKKKECVSNLAEFAEGTIFQRVLTDDYKHKDLSKVKRVLFCSGKIYYDLFEERAKRNMEEQVLIIRLEQLSPFPFEQLYEVMNNWNKEWMKTVEWTWVQEEHENMGAYTFVAPRLNKAINTVIHGDNRYNLIGYIGRIAASAPATGLKYVHEAEVKHIMNSAFKF
ncbi:hypothetical protein C9374_002574 [Naegleria lovaniensis]|uniref:Transketolase-like pyrimidine-binding domain-containing protein n=1 Tax=Naegleria lovaniensis TaxID=51637 RepID=A0AA88GU96_NAELO|nr:uncharacterized protein C9374_002574 [Naegleria lovaniensis]KAG2386128.1 hypothetical protein C9374_002574 [Naegleria lovaniensis]